MIARLAIQACLSIALGLAPAVAPAAAEAQGPATFHTSLEAVAFDADSRSRVGGKGQVDAVLIAGVITVSGRFEALRSAATRARVFRGAAPGVPGQPLFDLVVTPASAGTLSGTFTVDASLQEALRDGCLYVQIDSQEAPGGAVWGWLMRNDISRGRTTL